MPADKGITGLFSDTKPVVGYAQGEIVSWDTVNGTNAVNVGGSLFENVPVFNSGEAVALQPGHVVGLLRFKTSYFILGRITLPDSAEFGSAAVDFETINPSATNFSLTSSYASKVSQSIAVPSWATHASILAIGTSRVGNPTATPDTFYMQMKINGANAGAEVYVLLSAAGGVDDIHSLVVAGAAEITSPGSSIAVGIDMKTSAAGGWSAVASNYVNVSAQAIFRSTT